MSREQCVWADVHESDLRTTEVESAESESGITWAREQIASKCMITVQRVVSLRSDARN